MARVCQACGRVVAEAAYCPFCSQPTIEHVPVPVNRSDATTVRTLFEQKKHWLAIVSLISYLMPGVLLLFQILFGASRAYPFFAPCCLLAGFSCLVVALITALYGRFYAFPCPRCEKNIDLKAIGQNVRYCPFCGMNLDLEIDPETHEPKQFLHKEWGQRRFEIKNTGIQLPPGKEEKPAAT